MSLFRRFLTMACIFATLYFTPSTLRAQCAGGSCPARGPRAVVRVVHSTGPCRVYGTGTLVHDDGRSALVLSCAHLFRDGVGRVSVVFSDGRQAAAAPVAVDATWDLSALEVASTGIAPVLLAAEAPKPGEPLESCGYGPDGAYRCNSGQARGYTNGPGTTTFETLCLAGAARDGDSGGPVLNARGELVGVVWGTDGHTVHATYCGRVRRFLEKLLPKRPLLPGAGPAARMPPPVPPGEPPTDATVQPGHSPEQPPAILDRFDALAKQLDAQMRQRSDRDEKLASRLGMIESALAAIGGLRERLEAQPPAAGDAVRSAAPSLLAAVLPGVLAALGWTAPPSLAAILALRIGLAILRRRAERRKTEKTADHSARSRAKPLNDQYARQLNAVYALSGRSTTADATLGREYDRELCEMEAGAEDAVARWAQNLRRRVCDRFLRIHDLEPLPAEPK